MKKRANLGGKTKWSAFRGLDVRADYVIPYFRELAGQIHGHQT